MFGLMGAYPLGLPFESDEYLSTLQAQLQEPNGGGAPSVNLQFHGLATLHAGESDQLDAESKVSLTQTPGDLDWSCSLMLSLSRIVQRHWLLDLYSLATAPAVAAKDKAANASVVSLYLQDLVAREPRLRSTISITAGLSGHQSDATIPARLDLRRVLRGEAHGPRAAHLEDRRLAGPDPYGVDPGAGPRHPDRDQRGHLLLGRASGAAQSLTARAARVYCNVL